MTESPTERFLKLVTHPTQIIRRSDVRKAEQASARRISPRLSTGLLVAAASISGVGIAVAVLGVLIRLPGVLLTGALLLSGGMALATLEGLMLPEREQSPAWTAIKKVMHR